MQAGRFIPASRSGILTCASPYLAHGDVAPNLRKADALDTILSNFDTLRTRIDARMARVGIIGLGYVGLPLAMAMAGGSFPTRGFDIGLELYYAAIRHSTRSAAIAATLAAAGVKRNPNDWAVKLRVQRTF